MRFACFRLSNIDCIWISRVLVSAILLFSTDAYSWSGRVHSSIGDAVYALLDKKERAYYDKLAKRLPGKAKAFRDMSHWVDTVRGVPIFELFDKKVPSALDSFQAFHSGKWHYENYAYFGEFAFHGKSGSRKSCRVRNTGQLEEALTALDQSAKTTLTPEQEAIVIAFIMHLIEDMHQPLHTTTLVDSDCNIDRGGNLFCLKKHAKKCVLNLHYLWDTGFGATRDKQFMSTISESQKTDLPFSIELNLMLTQGRDLAKEAYRTEENRVPHQRYMSWAESSAKKQIEKSVQRVARYLKKHYEQNN